MRISCTQENLHRGLNMVSNIANKNSNLPILNNVLIKASKTGLTLTTTDLEIGIKVFVRGKADQIGEFTVDAKLINNFVNLLPRENINLNLKGNSLEIKSNNQETSIKGIEAEDFPLIPDIEKNNEVVLNSNDLKKSLSQVLLAASLDASRVEINAVNFIFQKNNLVLAATDSYRLAEKKIKTPNNKKEANLIIPLKTLQELSRILGEQNNQEVHIYYNENQIMFVFDGVELISRVIDGRYPDYKQIIPNDFLINAQCEVNKLIPAIKSVALFCKQGINDIKLSFDKNKKQIVVATASSATGNSVAKVPATITGEDTDIIFNYRYLLDGLGQMDDKDVVLKMNNNSSPGLIAPISDPGYLYLVMPIRQ